MYVRRGGLKNLTEGGGGGAERWERGSVNVGWICLMQRLGLVGLGWQMDSMYCVVVCSQVV